MNVTRIAILGVAAIAAGAAALLVRGMLGGGTPASQAKAPPPAITAEVLVASKDIAPGHALDAAMVRWEAWPKSAVSSTFITKEAQPDITKAVSGVVVRAPLVTGQPITDASIVRTGATGFLAATMTPGMRAIGVNVTAETTAGGFILPNDHVDVVFTRDLSGGNGPKNFQSETILRDVRVLAVDQTSHQEKDQQTVVGKTATLELMPEQAELLARSQQSGILSLALRALGDSSGTPVADSAPAQRRPVRVASPKVQKTEVVVFRYGVLRSGAPGGGAESEAAAPSAPATGTPAPSAPTEVAPSEQASITNPITISRAPVAIGLAQ